MAQRSTSSRIAQEAAAQEHLRHKVSYGEARPDVTAASGIIVDNVVETKGGCA